MKQDIVMNHYNSALIMGEEVFLIYLTKTNNSIFIKMINDFLSSIKKQQKELKSYLKSKNIEVNDECSTLQKNAIMMERLKMKVIKDDYELGLTMIKTMNQAILGALRYYRKFDNELKKEFYDIIKYTISNYDNIIGKIKKTLLDMEK